MIDKHRLQGWIVENWVMFDKHGERIQGDVPTNSGPAALLVEDVTDALKVVEDGEVVASTDRRDVWRVRAIVLNKVVVDRLPEAPMEAEELLDAVRDQGLAWQISSSSAL